MTTSKKVRHYSLEALNRYAKSLGFGAIHTKIESQSGLNAIIAVHSTARGPAIGGCRFHHYPAAGEAMSDALRLAYMMTLKAALIELPHGGAKAVIIEPKKPYDREQLFTSFGDFVHEINGRYITACDVGTSTRDMDTIAKRTPYVIGAAKTHQHESDPAPHTAMGVFQGMRAALAFKNNSDSFKNITVAIQGAGSVAFELTRLLTTAGANIIACDPNQEKLDHLVKEFNIKVTDIEDIYDANCDIFSPCALGGTLNHGTTERIKAGIIAGCANNQLGHKQLANTLKDKGILYAPDFLINSGGLIHAAITYARQDDKVAEQKIEHLFTKTLKLFEQSAKENLAPSVVANMMAKQQLLKANNATLKDINTASD